ncbi:Uncharacterised protein [Mycobacteroides abscessus subsp. abscessus]|nr:Uncharacterised protein [Mycobacteroides abscessus subsp. abscessus]
MPLASTDSIAPTGRPSTSTTLPTKRPEPSSNWAVTVILSSTTPALRRPK